MTDLPAFAQYRDAIANLRLAIRYKDSNPEQYNQASQRCKDTWTAWQKERKAITDDGQTN